VTTKQHRECLNLAEIQSIPRPNIDYSSINELHAKSGVLATCKAERAVTVLIHVAESVQHQERVWTDRNGPRLKLPSDLARFFRNSGKARLTVCRPISFVVGKRKFCFLALTRRICSQRQPARQVVKRRTYVVEAVAARICNDWRQ
jgi:hypothetical protein